MTLVVMPNVNLMSCTHRLVVMTNPNPNEKAFL